VPRWVTVFGRVNHLGAQPGTRAYSVQPASVQAGLSTWRKAGKVNRHIAWYISPYPWSRSVRWMRGWWLASGDQRRLTGSGSALEACSRRCAIQIHWLLNMHRFKHQTHRSGTTTSQSQTTINGVLRMLQHHSHAASFEKYTIYGKWENCYVQKFSRNATTQTKYSLTYWLHQSPSSTKPWSSQGRIQKYGLGGREWVGSRSLPSPRFRSPSRFSLPFRPSPLLSPSVPLPSPPVPLPSL